MTNNKLKVRVDEENGCEECWNQLEQETGLDRLTLPDEFELEEKFLHPCTHGAPAHAPSILVVL